MTSARLRLLSLWVSQGARIMADNCLRMFIVLRALDDGPEAGEFAWNVAAAAFLLPALVGAPLNGAICNSLPRRRVLVASAAFCLIVTCVFAALNTAWLACLALVACGNAVYSPARYAMLPAAAREARLPLSRINGWLEMGAVSAFIAGILAGGYLHGISTSAIFGFSPTIALIVGLNGLCLVTALPVGFQTDVQRDEDFRHAVAGFFRDSRRIILITESRAALLAMTALRSIVLAAAGPALAINFTLSIAGEADPIAFFPAILMVLCGAAIGAIVASIQGHPTRILGLVPFGATVMALALVVGALLHPIPSWAFFVVGAMAGLINVPIFTTYQASLPADARGNGLAVLNAAGYAGMAGLALIMAALNRWRLVSVDDRLWIVFGLTAIGAAIAWRYLYRDVYEQVIEILFWPIFRVRGFGPGLTEIPTEGPLIVLANHSAWFDPLWLGKVLPRRLIGMLTSEFYDKPGLHFLAKYVVHSIRVESSGYRREVPELDVAVATLDRGECVLIFPEGQMRKKEAVPLRRFGRGVWQLISRRPQTRVVICWIEGGWGSFTSYYGGPPTRNKRFDWWRRIEVAVAAPELLDPKMLDDHHAARQYLMRKCLDARRYLGLEPLPLESNPPD